MAEFRMPSLGADMDVGTVVEWLVKPGDAVRKGDIVAVVDTAKSDVEVETFVGGVVEQILVGPGEQVPVGALLATITAPGEPAMPPATAPPAMPPAPAPPATPKPAVTSPLVRRLAADLGVDLTHLAGTGEGGAITRADVEHAAPPPVIPTPRHEPVPAAPTSRRVSPYARRLAAELGVDLAAVTGTGVAGTVRAADVRAAATQAATAKAPAEPAAQEKRDAMRSAIARLMSRAKREIPHYYLTTTVDLSNTTTWLRERNRQLAVSDRLVPAAPLLKATALAARRHPELNGFWIDDSFVPGASVHLGVAVSLRGGGLVAPALHDAADLPVPELMAKLRDLVTRARAGRLRRTELADPTITVTNLGDQGVESVLGVIYPPQVALVGFGRVVDRPWAVDGLLGVRPVVTLTLAADHRATDGFSGARFLATIDELLQDPEKL